jgi:hypothetical protein
MTCFGLFDWPSSGACVVYIKEKTASGRGLSFTDVKYIDHIKIIIPKSVAVLRK